MRLTRLTRLTLRGLKASDQVIPFGPLTCITGGTGAGKSAVLQALDLLCTGAARGISRPGTKGARGDDILRLARDGRIEITGEYDRDGETITAKRSWARQSNGKVAHEITITGPWAPGEIDGNDGPMSGLEKRAAWLAHNLGGLSAAWRPDDLLMASEDVLRSKLLALTLPQSSLRTWVPDDCPRWAHPLPSYTPDGWARWALREARQRLTAERASLKALTGEGGPVHQTPVDLAPIEARLAEMRGRMTALAARQPVERRVADLERRAGEARKALAAAGDERPDPAAARARLDAAKAAADLRRRLEAEGAALLDRVLRERAKAARLPEGEADEFMMADARDAAEAAHLVVLGLDRQLARAAAAVDILGRSDDIVTMCSVHEAGDEECCLVASAADKIQRLAEARAERAEIEDKIKSATGVLAARRAAESTVLWQIERAEIVAALAVSERELDAITGRLELMPRGHELDATVRRETADLRRIEALPRQEQIDHLEAELGRARADLAALPLPGPTLGLDSEILRAQAELKAAAARNRDAEHYATALAEIRSTEAGIEELVRWRDTFARIQTAMLARAKGLLEEQISAVAGAAVEVSLVSDRDAAKGATEEDEDLAPCCRILVGGVDQFTLSGGERWLFVASVIRALAAGTTGVWRPLIADGLESVSVDRRPAALLAIAEAIEAGEIDQAILAGCDDRGLDGPGVSVVRVPAAAPAQAEPESSGPERVGRVWRVPSDRDPRVIYEVTQGPSGEWRCACPGFVNRGKCKHQKRVAEEQLSEQVRSAGDRIEKMEVSK